jgi:multiple sugar transport system substrate-binding protein
MENGFPQPNWPGASQYVEDFAIHVQRAIAGQETPKQALDNVAEKWRTTVDELGRESQTQAYQQFIEKAREFGYVE